MSYDLMVFEPSAAPRDRSAFMEWYRIQTEWSEEHSYDDPANTSLVLQQWFAEFSKTYPPMNGPHAVSEDRLDDPFVTDHCIGKNLVYSAFAWSVAESALPAMRELALKHGAGFFDVSAEEGEILFPDFEEMRPKRWWPFRK